MKKSIAFVLASVAFLAGALIVSAQSQPRVFMLVTAAVEPGQMADYLASIENDVLPIFEENDVEFVGAFQSGLGGNSNETFMLVGFRDLAHVQTAFSDPAIVQLQQTQFEAMRVLNTRLLTPTSFSPLR